MCDFLPRGGTCYILLDYILLGWDFFHFTGTGTVRWRAEGAALGSQSEPTLHIIYRYRYTLLPLYTTPVWNPDDV